MNLKPFAFFLENDIFKTSSMVLKTTLDKKRYKRVLLELRIDYYEFASKIARRNKIIKKYGNGFNNVKRLPNWKLLRTKSLRQWHKSSLLKSQFLYANSRLTDSLCKKYFS